MQMNHFLIISHSVNHTKITSLDNLLDPNSKGGMVIFLKYSPLYQAKLGLYKSNCVRSFFSAISCNSLHG